MVLEYLPKDMKALLRRGLALEAKDQFRSALADIRQYLLLDPKNKIANAASHRIGTVVRRLKAEGTKI